MNQKRLASQVLLSALLLLLFATTSCLDEKYETRGSAGGEKSVTFSLSLPGTVPGRSTYALTPTDEEEVANVQVLLFSPGDLYLDTRNVSSTAITSVGNKKQFTVQIPEGTYSSIVVLGNSADIVSGAGLALTDNKADALAKLTVANPGTWVADKTDAAYRPIPMWSELGSTVVNQTTSTNSQSSPLQLSLTRMLAKVSVKLSDAASTNFQLKTIYTPNSYDRGYVAPLAANWGLGVATAASVPAGATKQLYNLSYSDAQITTPDVASEGEIYLFESDNANQAGSGNRTCLILGGLYLPENKFCHYRVEFVSNSGGTDSYIDLLRNHHYTFNVTKIDGPGYPTPNEAFESKPINIEATLAYNDDAAITHVASNERYMLGLSQKEYTYILPYAHTAASTDNKMTLFTDYSDGWHISPTDIIDLATNTTATWLTLDAGDQSGLPHVNKTISLNLTQNSDDTKAYRSANILVKAGTLTLVVRVTQWFEYYPPMHSGWAGSNIYWDGSKLTFDNVGDQTHKNYQGVYFQWGSLTGISPVDDYSTSTLLYLPGAIAPTSGTAWAAIIRVGDDEITSNLPLGSNKSNRDRAYLYEIDTTTDTGDICKYITEQAGGSLYGKKWRMPTSTEFGDAGSFLNWISGNAATAVASGANSVFSGRTKSYTGTPFFPAGGYRFANNGSLGNVGTNCAYWSGSPGGKNGGNLTLADGVATPFNNSNRLHGFSVRCVAE